MEGETALEDGLSDFEAELFESVFLESFDVSDFFVLEESFLSDLFDTLLDIGASDSEGLLEFVLLSEQPISPKASKGKRMSLLFRFMIFKSPNS